MTHTLSFLKATLHHCYMQRGMSWESLPQKNSYHYVPLILRSRDIPLLDFLLLKPQRDHLARDYPLALAMHLQSGYDKHQDEHTYYSEMARAQQALCVNLWCLN